MPIIKIWGCDKIADPNQLEKLRDVLKPAIAKTLELSGFQVTVIFPEEKVPNFPHCTVEITLFPKPERTEAKRHALCALVARAIKDSPLKFKTVEVLLQEMDPRGNHFEIKPPMKFGTN
jgi:phenylpyruvate tautomerase PptA (4-oxalocrotonate tautomerase family)